MPLLQHTLPRKLSAKPFAHPRTPSKPLRPPTKKWAMEKMRCLGCVGQCATAARGGCRQCLPYGPHWGTDRGRNRGRPRVGLGIYVAAAVPHGGFGPLFFRSVARADRRAGGPNDHRIPDGINEDEPEPLQRRCLLLLPRRPSHGIHMAVSRLALRLSPGCTGTLCISPLASNSAWAFRSPHPTCSFRPSSVHGSIQHRPNNRNVPTGRPSERRLPCPPPS